MWAFLSRRLRTWVLLAVALPLARMLVHRMAVAADRRDPRSRTARTLRQADSTVTVVSQRAARRKGRSDRGRSGRERRLGRARG